MARRAASSVCEHANGVRGTGDEPRHGGVTASTCGRGSGPTASAAVRSLRNVELADRCFEETCPWAKRTSSCTWSSACALKDTDDPVSDLTLVLVSTIDTDSFLTMLLDRASVRCASAAQRTCSPCCACASARRQVL